MEGRTLGRHVNPAARSTPNGLVRIRRIAAGLADSAFAALCTFAVGLAAVRTLPNAGVALFSLMLTGYIIGMILPRNFVLTHIELSANRSEVVYLPKLAESVVRAAAPLALAVVVAVCSGLPAWRHVTPAEYACMAVGAGAATLGGAILAHVRAAMHLVGQHEYAGVTSAVNFAVTMTLLVLGELVITGTGRWAVPFAAMALGQGCAMLMWLRASRKVDVRGGAEIAPRLSRLQYLVPVGATQLAIYVQSSMILERMGAASSAALESARVAASPVYICASGLGALLVPPLVRSLRSETPRHTIVGLVRGMAAVAGVGFVYSAALVLLESALSLLLGRRVDGWLAGARAASFAIDGPTTLNQGLFIALNLFTGPALLSVLAAIVVVGVTAASMTALGLYSVPFGLAIGALVQFSLGLRLTRKALIQQQPST